MLVRLLQTGVCVAIAFNLAACAGGSGGGRTGSGSGAASAGPSALNQPQWQTAMAALAQMPAFGPEPVRLEQHSMVVWNDILAQGWLGIEPTLRTAIEGALQSYVGQTLTGSVSVMGVRNVIIDVLPPPAMLASQPAPVQTFELAIPRDPLRWSVAFSADIGTTVTVNLFGSSMQVPVIADVDVAVTNIQIKQAIDLDLADPDNVRILGPGTPTINMRLSIGSNAPVVGNLLGRLNQVLDPVVRTVLVLGMRQVQQEVAALLQQFPVGGGAWGRGGTS